MIDKSFLYFGRPQTHQPRLGIILVHIPKAHMQGLENFLVAINERSSFFKIYKKYELGENFYFVNSSNGPCLEILFKKLQQFIVEAFQIHISQAESRAKFRRKVKSWVRKMESIESGLDLSSERVYNSPLASKISILQKPMLRAQEQDISDSQDNLSDFKRKDLSKLKETISEIKSSPYQESVQGCQTKSIPTGLLKRKEDQLMNQLSVQLKAEKVVLNKKLDENKQPGEHSTASGREVKKLTAADSTIGEVVFQNNTPLVGKVNALQQQPQTILHVNGINLFKTNGLMGLCRLFSSFGEIDRAVYNTVKCYALIQFVGHEAAETCIELLDGLDLGGDDMLCVTYSKKLSLNNLKGPQSTYLNYKKESVTNYSQKQPKFKSISSTLLLELQSGLTFSTRGPKLKMLILDKCQKLGVYPTVLKSSQSQNVWICSFICSEEAALALMHLHGLIVGHQSLRANLHNLSCH